MEIGKRLKQYRLQLGLTQEELASRTELTKGY
ncbi:MAG: helix-turn-helix domain-containing protein, partial [Clostridia bacterium]|nr:helix-turn-helix domain-containing protein [Clostridia bacterium]